jgi:hypothetical protein
MARMELVNGEPFDEKIPFEFLDVLIKTPDAADAEARATKSVPIMALNGFLPQPAFRGSEPSQRPCPPILRVARDTPKAQIPRAELRDEAALWRNIGNENVLYHSLLGLASGERFRGHLPEMG